MRSKADKVLTHALAPLKLRYHQAGDSDRGAVRPAVRRGAWSSKLAFKMGHWLTGKRSFAERALTIYQDALSAARLADALESTVSDVYADDVIAARWL